VHTWPLEEYHLTPTVGPWDLVLVLVVSVQSTVLAYVHAPRWKALLLSLPFPFTTIAMSLGRPVDATNVVALTVLLVYMQSVRFMHQRLRVPIVPAIAPSVLLYCAIGWALAGLVPTTGVAFWVAILLTLVFAAVIHARMPHRVEPGHRTSLPVWRKLPLMVGVIAFLMVVKSALGGFATLFPLLGVTGAYEARHSLFTFARQMPLIMLTLALLMVVSRLAHPVLGLGPSLALGWLAFLVGLVLLTRAMWSSLDGSGKEPRPLREEA